MELPDAPPTESSASTRGTPAANMVASVRVHRAMHDFSTSAPKIGILIITRSITCCTRSLRRHACIKKYKPPPILPKISHQYLTKISLTAMMNKVGAGRSAPNELNTCLNAGITKIMMTATTTKATTSTEMGYISADLILDLIASVFSMYTARRSSNCSKIPAASPASTKLQYRLSKYSGNLRKAADSDVPVSTSVRMSLSSLVTLGFGLPRPTMSKACSRGTPAFIMVANWRVKIAMSLGLIDLPERMRRFLIFEGKTPWRLSDAITWFSPAARISPRTTLPLRSLPSHS